MTVRCLYCGESIALNPDGAAEREAGTDPHQQLRQHLVTRHAADIEGHARGTGWLVDMMAFDSPDDPQGWRGNILRLVDFLLTANERVRKRRAG